MHTLNLSHLLPLSTIWAGERFNPCDKYPPNSPPLMMGATEAARRSASTSMSATSATRSSWDRPARQIDAAATGRLAGPPLPGRHNRLLRQALFGFIPTKAVGGAHYDIAGDHNEIAFAPFSRLKGEKDMSWATGWVEMCVELQGVKVSPTHRKAIGDAVRLVALSEHRTFTALAATIQDTGFAHRARTLPGRRGIPANCSTPSRIRSPRTPGSRSRSTR